MQSISTDVLTENIYNNLPLSSKLNLANTCHYFNDFFKNTDLPLDIVIRATTSDIAIHKMINRKNVFAKSLVFTYYDQHMDIKSILNLSIMAEQLTISANFLNNKLTFPIFQNMKHVVLSNIFIDDAVLESLGSNLNYLDISTNIKYCNAITEDGFGQFLRKNRNLETLLIKGHNLDKQITEQLLHCSPKLKQLNIDWNNYEDDFLLELGDALPNLEMLSIKQERRISLLDGHYISTLISKLKMLEELHVYKCLFNCELKTESLKKIYFNICVFSEEFSIENDSIEEIGLVKCRIQFDTSFKLFGGCHELTKVIMSNTSLYGGNYEGTEIDLQAIYKDIEFITSN